MAKMRGEKPELTYFTADPHFFHEAIIKYCERPFKDAAEMNKALIDNWNAVVPEKGEIFILGDLFWKNSNRNEMAAIMKRLHGKKFLVRGNHDSMDESEYASLGFAGVFDYLELTLEKQKLALFHYPVLEWAGFYQGSWHLHGHVHGRGNHFSKRVMDVGVDANFFMPVHWKAIQGKLEGGFEKDRAILEKSGLIKRHGLYVFKD